MFLDEVRKPLLEEAKQSPNLLSDLAGLEQYIAEGYNARAICELLQNADDASASRFKVLRSGEFVLVANDGRVFSKEDFESLCRSAHSTKARGVSIGYRGIGFKSVVGIANEVHIFSGQLEATFSRDRTAQEIPEAARVPLIRIPHALLSSERSRVAGAADELRGEGFQTIFVFTHLVFTSIQVELSTFDLSSLLFLRHIQQLEIQADENLLINVTREAVDKETRVIRLENRGNVSIWKVIERDGMSVAFDRSQTGIQRLAEPEAVVHAFLPTHEPTGFSMKINGDISTDPSRTRVVLDERTADCVEQIANLIVDLIDRTMNTQSQAPDLQMLAALIPLSDPRLASLQRRSFKTDLLAALQRAAKSRFEAFVCRPAWLNPIDFQKLAETSEIKAVRRQFGEIEGLNGFLKFLGARDATLEDIGTGLQSITPSLVGAAEVIAHVTSRYATKQIEATAIDKTWQLWPVDGVPRSLSNSRRTKRFLDADFLDLVAEKTGGVGPLKRLLSDLVDSGAPSAMLPPETPSPALPLDQPEPGTQTSGELWQGSPTPPMSLKRWRGAEQQVLALLKAKGWKVTDVSRQNIGYDIEGFAPDGGEMCIEVKAIAYPGQPFTLTSNEEAVAREKGTAYVMALVHQTESHLEVAFIRDPITHLKLVRQCKQWAWECATYSYDPERYPLE
jgi:uncharacterized protein DUF3883